MQLDYQEAYKKKFNEYSERLDLERQYLNVLTQDYVLVNDVDLYEDHAEAVKIMPHANVCKMSGMHQGTNFKYSEHIKKFAEQFVVNDKKEYLNKLNIEYILQQMKQISRYAFQFESAPNQFGNKYYEVQIVRANPYVFDGRVLVVSREIDDVVTAEQRRQIELAERYEREQNQNEVMAALGRGYQAIFRIDVQKDTYDRISCHEKVVKFYDPNELSASRALESLCENAIDERFMKRMQQFFDLSTLGSRLREKDSIEMECVVKDGNWHRARFIAKKRDAEGNVTSVLYVTQIIDEEKRYQEYLLSRVENANLANKAKTEFISQVAHDIRTPMNAIFGFLEIAKANVADEETVAYALDKMYQSGVFLKELVSDVLDIAKMESNKVQLRPEKVSLQKFFDEIISATINEQTKKKHKFYIDINLPYDCVIVDRLRLKQIYANILSNAVKYTPEGGIIEFVAFEQEILCENKVRLVVEIRDTGIGMSKEFMDKMFDEYERAVDTRINKVSGYGLGLSIVKRLVNLMDGTIEAQSQVGEGSIFTVCIDVPYVKESVSEDNLVQRKDYKEICKGMHLLVAEDNELNQEVLTELLKMYDITCDCVENGEICLEKVQMEEGIFDAILMDMQMPVMNGLEATKQIRALPLAWTKAIPIIAMTANAMKEDVQNCLDAGMNAHLSKPIDMEQVLKILAEFR